MQTLYNKLKLDVYKTLKENQKTYVSVGAVLDKLRVTEQYKDLTIEDVRKLQTFSGVDAGYGDSSKSANWDWMFGDAWFNEVVEPSFTEI